MTTPSPEARTMTQMTDAEIARIKFGAEHVLKDLDIPPTTTKWTEQQIEVARMDLRFIATITALQEELAEAKADIERLRGVLELLDRNDRT